MPEQRPLFSPYAWSHDRMNVMKKVTGVFSLTVISFILSFLLFFQVIPGNVYPAVSGAIFGGESFQIISADPGAMVQLTWAYEAFVPRPRREKPEDYQHIRDISFKRLDLDENWSLSAEGYPQTGNAGARLKFSYPKFTTNVFVFCFKTTGGNAIIRHDYPGGHSFYRIEGGNVDGLPFSSCTNSDFPWKIPQWTCMLSTGVVLSILLSALFLKRLRRYPLIEPEPLPEKRISHSCWAYLFAFLLPALTGLLVCRISGFTPFGERTFLYNDMFNQYYKFLLYLKDMPKEGNDLFYSFSEILGGSMYSLFSYYLTDPLYLLVRLFDGEQMPLFCTLMILLHLGLAGESSFFYLTQKGCSLQASFLFSCAYALMAFNIVCAENLQFLTDMVLLPLIIHGLERLIRQQKGACYVTCLAAGLILNCYFGYMICIFAFLWFLFISISEKRNSFSWDFLNFLMHSILAIGIAMVILLPFALSLRDGPKTLSLVQLKPEWVCTLPELLSKLFTASFDHAQMEYGAPSLFCGTVTTVFASLFFLKSDHKRKRLAALGVAGIYLLSFTVSTFYLIWHGFNYPIWWPARFAFTFGFFITSLAAEAFDEPKRCSRKEALTTLILFVMICLVVSGKGFAHLSNRMVLLDLVIVLVTLLTVLPIFPKNPLSGKLSSIVLFFLLITDLSINMFHIWTTNFEETHPETAFTSEEYKQNYRAMHEAAAQIKSHDDEFYRVEYALKSGENPGMLNSTNGLSHFSSTGGNAVRRFLDRIGFTSRYRLSANYRYGSTMAVDTLLGIRFLVSESDLVRKPYPTLFQNTGLTVQQNSRALSLGITASPEILTVSFRENMVFDNQEALFSAIAGKELSLFTPAEATLNNIENLSSDTSDQYAVWTKTEPDMPGILTWNIQIDRPEMIYAFFPVISHRTASITVNGEPFGKTIDPDNYGIIPLGVYRPGEEITLSLRFDAESIAMMEPMFEYEDQNYFSGLSGESGHTFDRLEKISSSHLAGEINAEKEGQWMLLTIPYSDEWKITLNGKPVTTEKVMDALIAFPLEQGQNSVELSYTPSGFKIGALISLFSLCVFLLEEVKRFRRDKRL